MEDEIFKEKGTFKEKGENNDGCFYRENNEYRTRALRRIQRDLMEGRITEREYRNFLILSGIYVTGGMD